MAQIDLADRGLIAHRDGTIAVGGVSQRILRANPNLLYIFIQNPSDQSESLFINIGRPATLAAGNWELLPGSWFERFVPGWIPIEDINVAAATPGHPFTFKTC